MGYDGVDCTDVDECTQGTATCDITVSTCSNTVGSYECVCIDGYIHDAGVCVDIDKCATSDHNCEEFCRIL